MQWKLVLVQRKIRHTYSRPSSLCIQLCACTDVCMTVNMHRCTCGCVHTHVYMYRCTCSCAHTKMYVWLYMHFDARWKVWILSGCVCALPTLVAASCVGILHTVYLILPDDWLQNDLFLRSCHDHTLWTMKSQLPDFPDASIQTILLYNPITMTLLERQHHCSRIFEAQFWNVSILRPYHILEKFGSDFQDACTSKQTDLPILLLVSNIQTTIFRRAKILRCSELWVFIARFCHMLQVVKSHFSGSWPSPQWYIRFPFLNQCHRSHFSDAYTW